MGLMNGARVAGRVAVRRGGAHVLKSKLLNSTGWLAAPRAGKIFEKLQVVWWCVRLLS